MPQSFSQLVLVQTPFPIAQAVSQEEAVLPVAHPGLSQFEFAQFPVPVVRRAVDALALVFLDHMRCLRLLQAHFGPLIRLVGRVGTQG